MFYPFLGLMLTASSSAQLPSLSPTKLEHGTPAFHTFKLYFVGRSASIPFVAASFGYPAVVCSLLFHAIFGIALLGCLLHLTTP